ncbi:MAG: PaaI family thioesterase [Sphingomicrobium sp.]
MIESERSADGSTNPSPAGLAATDDGRFDPLAFFAIIEGYGHSGALGMRYCDHGEDWVEVALPWREALVGVTESGVLATGAIVSLVDLAASISVWLKHGLFVPTVTLDLRIDYLRPASKGETVFARCRCVKVGRSIAFIEGVAHVGDARDPIARAALTFMTS